MKKLYLLLILTLITPFAFDMRLTRFVPAVKLSPQQTITFLGFSEQDKIKIQPTIINTKR